MAGARVSEDALFRIINAVKRSHKDLVGGGIEQRQLAIDMPQKHGWRVSRSGEAVCQAMRDRHHHRGRRAVTADIRDQDSPATSRQGEEVVIIAARPARRAIVRRQLDCRDLGQNLRQQRALNVGHNLELALDDLVRLLELVTQQQVMRYPAEQAAHPAPLGKPLRLERRRLGLQHDHHVQGRALIVVRYSHERTEACQVGASRVVVGKQGRDVVD